MYLNRNKGFFIQPQKHKLNSNKQSGVSMAFLLFAIIIISLLAAGLMQLNSQSGLSTAHQVVSTRAFFAAESGANFQALAIFPVNGGSGICANQNYTFSASGLNGCRAATTCNSINIEGTNYYQVISQGQCNSGQSLQATRTIEIRLKTLTSP